MIIADSCSIILLAKATILEKTIEVYNLNITPKVLEEVIKGKDKMHLDALIVEKLKNENKLKITEDNKMITQKLAVDFNMGFGEASTISAAKDKKCIVVTDNKQGRKVALINNIDLVGSPDVIVGLFKKKKISKEKAISALNVLKKEGWFENYILEKAREDIK